MHLVSSRLFVVLVVGLVVLFVGGPAAPAIAQEGEITPERPFQLPFAESASPDTWLLAQPYGNTTGAYRRRLTTYGASGGIHFGVDLSAPCGTDIVAIADGVVFAVDGPFGSPPHNLMIDHPQLGYASMYGHLLEPPDLRPGQRVKQGQVVATVGDSGETCYSRPHLHLEIRDLAHIRKYNPATLIDANWDSLALTGSNGRDFARDLDEPRKWQSLYDQPQVVTGGPIVNDFPNPWPPDWEKEVASNTSGSTPLASIVPAMTPSPTPDQSAPAVGRQLTAGDCCTNLSWSQDSSQVRFIDRPSFDAALGIWGVDASRVLPDPELVTSELRHYSPDDRLVAYPNVASGTTIIERLVNGQTWEIDTQGNRPAFSPDSRQIMWTVFDEDAPRDTRLEAFWLSGFDGSNARVVLSARRTDVVDWLSDDTLLLTRRVPGSSDETLLTLSLTDGRQTDLVTVPEPRGLALSPNKRYLVYYVTFEPNAAENGLWLLDLAAEARVPQKLSFFGTYRWADDERLIYVPFDPEATEHNFFEYNASTGDSRSLFPQGTNLTIANNDWRVSPDGTKIALVEAKGEELNGIWVLDINPVTDG